MSSTGSAVNEREVVEPEARRWERARGPLLAAAIAFAVVVPFTPQIRQTYDGYVMAQVAESLVRHATPLVHPVDWFGLNTPYSGYGIGTSIVMAAHFEIGRLLGADPAATLAMTNATVFAATAGVVFLLLQRRGFSRRVVVTATALVCLATPLLAYALSDFSEPGVALMVAIGMVGLDGSEHRRASGAMTVGMAIGCAGLFRTDSWLLVGVPMVVALWVLTRRDARSIAFAGFGALPFALVWMAYNAARFDSPLSSGYSNQPFSHPFWKGVNGLVLSPGRGVIVYVPLVLLAGVAFGLSRGGDRTLCALAVMLLGVRLVFFASWWSWFGGDSWGPRFMVPVLPAFAVALAVVIDRRPRSPILLITAGASVTMSAVGFAVAIGALPLTYHQVLLDRREATVVMAGDPEDLGERLMRAWTSKRFVRATDAVMFDWSRFPWRQDEDSG